MAKRQFSVSDTDPWADRYTDGSAGAKTYSSNHQMDSSDGAYYSRIGGTVGNKTANTPDLADGTYNLPCKIINEEVQTDTFPNWEFNFITSVSGGVATLRYALTFSPDYTGTPSRKSQIVTGKPYSSVVINNGVTINPPAWDGNKGGRLLWFARDSWTNHGTLQLTGYGFRGGNGVGADNVGFTGEGTVGNSVQTYNVNGNGAGGGGYSNNGPWDQGNGGGGGSNVTAGQNGITTGGGNNSNGGGGVAGNIISTTDGILNVMGGAGGGGGNKGGSGNSGNGGNGSGCVTVVSRIINSASDGAILLNGNSGQGNVNYHCGAGGSGAGGMGVFKGQQVTLLGNLQALGPGRVYRNGSSSGDEDGGYAGNGAFASYYGRTNNVSTNPSSTPVLDTILNDSGGAFEFLIA